MDGGGHERGLRSGTLNVPGIVGFGEAAALAAAGLPAEGARLATLRNRLETALLQLDEVYVNGSTQHRLPHVSNLSFRYLEGETLLMGFNKNVAVSSGSACTSASLEPSYVLKAMGVADAATHSSVRFGLGRFTDEEQIEYTISEITRTVQQLRGESLLWELRGKM
jgi:cysteine desulfurase